MAETLNAREFPDWTPCSVRELAQIIHEGASRTEDLELLDRLTYDSRMKKVWDELLRRKRIDYKRTETFLHEARSSGTGNFWSPEARKRRRHVDQLLQLNVKISDTQAILAEFAETTGLLRGKQRQTFSVREQALSFLFGQAFDTARKMPVVLSQAKAQRLRHHYIEMARSIRADADKDSRLLDAVVVYMEMADDAAPALGSPHLVKRQRGPDRLVRGFVLELASTVNAIFGTPLFGTVANIANVALGREDLNSTKVGKMWDALTCSPGCPRS